MATTLKLIKSATLTSTLSTTIATVGAGETWRVYNCRVACAVTGTALTLSIADSSSGLEKKIADAIVVAANTSYEIIDFIMEAGDILKGGATNAADIHIFGVVNT